MDGKAVFVRGETDDVKITFETSDLLTIDQADTTFQLFTQPVPLAAARAAAPGFDVPLVCTGISAGPAVRHRVSYRLATAALLPADYEGVFTVVGTMDGLPVEIMVLGLVRIVSNP